MRVLVLSSRFPSHSRPTYGVFVRERIRHVARHCELQVVAPVPWFPLNARFRGAALAATPRREVQDGLTVEYPRFVCLPGLGKATDGWLYALSLAPALRRLQQRFPFDLIDAHFTYPDGVGAAILGRTLGVPVVVTVRGTHDVRHAGFAGRRGQIRRALHDATRVIVVSEALRDFVLGLGIDESKTRVIPNGVDTTRFRPGDRAAARARLGLPVEGTVLLSVGTLVEGKGHHLVIEALPAIAAKHPRVLYVVVGGELGRGGDRQHLEALARRHGVGHALRLVGPRPHDEVPLWLAAADLFCLATRSEGWCNAITEAVACGVPVVTTRVGGNAEIVRDGRDGFLVPFWNRERFVAAVNDALERRWDVAEMALSASVTGWDRTATAVLEEFHRALSHAPAATMIEETRA